MLKKVISLLIPMLFVCSIAFGISRIKEYTSKASGDGYVQKRGAGVTAWSDVQNGTTGSSADDSSNTFDIYSSLLLGATPAKGQALIKRAFIPFDLTSVPAGVRFDSATIRLYPSAKSNGDNDGDDWINIIGLTSQASTGSLVVADYDQCGAVDNPTEYATGIDLGSITVYAINSWTVNSRGITEIESQFGSGDLLFGIREGHDALDISMSNGINSITVISADNVLNPNKPKLRITNYSYPQVI